MKIEEAARQWLEEKGRRWCEKVRKFVTHLAEDSWLPVIGDIELAEVKPEQIKVIYFLRDSEGRSAAALNQEGTYLKAFFNWMLDMEWLDKNPARSWRGKTSVVRRHYCTLSREEEARLIECAGPEWLKKFIPLAICTGLREGTLRLINWEWAITKEPLEFIIPAQAVKTRSAMRVPVAERARLALGPPSSGRVLNLPPAPIVWRLFKRAVKLAKLNPALTPHDCRRTFVERCCEAGVPIEQTMKLGGWKTLNTLIKYYYLGIGQARARAIVEQL